jgi:hypothetical protein
MLWPLPGPANIRLTTANPSYETDDGLMTFPSPGVEVQPFIVSPIHRHMFVFCHTFCLSYLQTSKMVYYPLFKNFKLI